MTVESLGSIMVKFEGETRDKLGLAIKHHVENHEGVTLIDIVKFLYQSVLGSLHILDHMSEREIEAWISKDFDAVRSERKPLMEKLYGPKWVRLDLGVFKHRYGSNKKLLISLFLNGREQVRAPVARFSSTLDNLSKLIAAGNIRPLSSTESLSGLVSTFFSEYKRMGYPPLHHSIPYSEKNRKYIVVPRESLTQFEM